MKEPALAKEAQLIGAVIDPEALKGQTPSIHYAGGERFKEQDGDILF